MRISEMEILLGKFLQNTSKLNCYKPNFKLTLKNEKYLLGACYSSIYGSWQPSHPNAKEPEK
jgi:hypothetical protein